MEQGAVPSTHLPLKLCLGAIVVAVSGWYFTAPSDEELIADFLKHGAAKASFDVGEAPLDRAAAANAISKMFVTQARFVVTSNKGEREHIVSNREIKERLLAVRTSMAQLAVTLEDIVVSVDGEKAIVTATGAAMGRDDGREDYFLEKHPIEVSLQKTDDGWKISEGRNLDVLDLGGAQQRLE